MHARRALLYARPGFSARGTAVRWLACLVLSACASASGCFSAPDAPPTERTCELNCARQAKLGCTTTAADFEATCQQACLAFRVSYPACVDAMNAMSGCVEDKVRFSCDAAGRIAHDPIAICMDEEYACYACTGAFAPCRN